MENEDSLLKSTSEIQDRLPSSINLSESYNPYSIPPQISLSLIHRNATKLGKSKFNSKEFCPCCGSSTEKEQFSLNCKLKELVSEVSFSHYIFLKLIKQMIFMVFIPYFFIVGSTHIILNIIEPNNTDRVYLDRQMADIIFLLYFYLFCNVLLPLWINRQLKAFYEYRRSIGALTLHVANLPDSWKKNELNLFFENNFNEKIKTIIGLDFCKISKNINQEVHKLLIKHKKLQTKIQIAIDTPHLRKNLLKLEKDMRKLENCMQNLMEKTTSYQTERNNKKIVKNHALIIFESNFSQRKIKNIWPNNVIYKGLLIIMGKSGPFVFKKKFLKIYEAPEPDELFVENVGYSNSYRFAMKILVLLFCLIMLLGFYFLLFSIINHSKFSVQIFSGNLDDVDISSTSEDDNIFIKYLPGFLTIVFNKILKTIFLKMSKLPKFICKSDYERFALNLVLYAQFVLSIANTFLEILIFIFVITIFSFLVKTPSNMSFFDLFNGLIEYYTMMFCLMLFMPIVHFFQTKQLVKFYKRKKLLRSVEEIAITQEKCNEIFEDAEFPLIEFYLDFNYIYMFGAFMWPLFPLWIVFSILSFGSLYYVFKYILLRNSTVKKWQSQTTFYELVQIIRKGPFLYSLNLFFLNLKYTIFLESDIYYNERIVASGIILTIALLMGFFSFFCLNSRTLKGLKIETKTKFSYEDLNEHERRKYEFLEKLI